ncbi:MAG TPA: GTP-binding protein [Acetobacteraceae bacterium]|nr:GTP-binding protein [Acetobacteraceae bacterium]
MLPVSVVTGFLGSGKTTLIGRILRDPGFARTAVIVNEFGEIGLDHTLIASSDETLLALTTGCLCCAVRSDLVATLLDLEQRREAGEIGYDRVLIETSGLADPAPILQALMTDPELGRTHTLDTVLTLADALLGEATLDRHPEARRQAAFADVVAISKTDLAPPDALRARLTALNPGARLMHSDALAPADLFTAADPALRAERLSTAARGMPSPFLRAEHTDGLESFTLQRDQPMPALALTLLLQALVEHCGSRLLRVKGLVEIAEMPGQPALVQGVQHVFSPPAFLPRWPSADRTTRMVFIARGVPRHFPARLLAAIEEEVRAAQAAG